MGTTGHENTTSDCHIARPVKPFYDR